MINKKFVLKVCTLVLIIGFSIYEIIYQTMLLLNRPENSGESNVGNIVGICLFSLIVIVATITLIIVIIDFRKRRYYVLKK